LARLDESIAAFNQRFILNLWNQGIAEKAHGINFKNYKIEQLE
jgi:hypothetical protein